MSVALRIPRHSEARRQQPPVGVIAGITWKSGVAGVNQTGRSVLIYRTLQTLLKAAVIEVVDEVVGLVLRRHWLPTEAIIHGQLWRHFPCVLRIQTEVILPVEKRNRTGLSKGGQVPQKEVGHTEVGRLPVKGKAARSAIERITIRPACRHPAAKCQLMRAPDNTHIISHLIVGRYEAGPRRGSAADGESARNRESCVFRNVTISVDTDIGGSEELRPRALDIHAAYRQPKSINHVGTDQVRIAKCKCFGQLVQTLAAGV